MEKASEEAIIQAGRNMLLAFKDSLVSELDSLIQSETEKAVSKDALAAIVPATVKAWAKNSEVSELSVLLSEKDLKELNYKEKEQLAEEFDLSVRQVQRIIYKYQKLLLL